MSLNIDIAAGLGGSGDPGGALAGADVLGSHAINQSLRVNQADDPFMTHTHSSSADDEGTCTISVWVKRSKLSSATRFMGVNKSTNYGVFGFASNDTLEFQSLNPTKIDFTTDRVFRDISAWYHIVVVLDIDNAVSTKRFKMYVNGVQETEFSTSTYPSTTDAYWNEAGAKHSVGCGLNSSGDHYQEFDGYIAEVNFIDGLVLDPTYFGETIGGVWVPKEYSGSYGDEGFYLPFSQNVSAGNSISFSGTSDRVEHADTTAYDIGSSDDFTIEFFFKTSEVGTGNGHLMGNYATGGPHHLITYDFRNSSTRKINFYSNNGQTLTWDISGDVTVANNTWHHVVFQRDGTTLRAYIDGTRLTSISNNGSSWSLSDGKATNFNKAYNLSHIRLGNVYTTNPIIGSLSNVRYVIGNTVYADDDNNITVPTETLTAVTGTKLLTAVNSTLGDDISTENNDGTTSGSPALSYDSPFTTENFFDDASGNGNDFSSSGVSSTNAVVPDSPTNNFAVLNPLQNSGGGGTWYAQATLSEGNLKASLPANSVSVASMKSTGKLYAEVRWSTVVNELALGLIIPEEYTTTTAHPINTGANSWRMAYHGHSPADIYLVDEGTSVANPAQAVSAGDIFQVAWDTDSGKIWFGYNNSWYDSSGGTTGDPSTGANATMTATTADLEASLVYIASGNSTAVGVINFGQDSTFAGAISAGGNADANGIGDFKYAPPSGFLALCSANLPEPTIGPDSTEQADDYFETHLWTGNGHSIAIGSNGNRNNVDTHTVSNSLRYNSRDTLAMKYTPSTAGNRQTWSFSVWVKRGELGIGQQQLFEAGTSGAYGSRLFWYFDSSNKLHFSDGNTNYGAGDIVCDDAGNWYHILVRCTGGSVTHFINGVLDKTQALSGDTAVNSLVEHGVGTRGGSGAGDEFDGYLAQFALFDGTAYEVNDVTNIGTNGGIIPKDISGLTYGTNGFLLEFGDSSNFGDDTSGQNNDMDTVSGFDATDQMIDSPSSSYNTMDPKTGGTAFDDLREGNLEMPGGSTADIGGVGASYSMPAGVGKWYWEVCVKSPNAGDNYPFIGVCAEERLNGSTTYGTQSREMTINSGTGGFSTNTTYTGTVTTNTTGVTSQVDGDVLGFAVDMVNKKMWLSENGTFFNSGDPAAGTGEQMSWVNDIDLFPSIHHYNNLGIGTTFNFGQDASFAGLKTAPATDKTDQNGYGNFLYDVPSGFLAMVDDNYPVEGVTSPDWVWLKQRNSTGSNFVYDTIRGATNGLNTNLTDTETPYSDGLLSFDSQGFTLGSRGNHNGNNDTFVGWTWKAGGPSPTRTYTVKVDADASDGDQNKYLFDGNTTIYAPTLTLQPGGTYTFDQSHSTNSGHPLRFSTTSDGTHGGGSEYTAGVTTTGTPGTDGTTTIVLANDAPTLYYYCSVHSGMGGQVTPNTKRGSSNLKGSIQSIVSAAPDAGFSVVSYTGVNTASGQTSTIGHGLASAPELVICKRKNSTYSWSVGSTVIGNFTTSSVFSLDSTAAPATTYAYEWGANPTDSVFTTGYSNRTNIDGGTFIAYCFHSVDGYCKVGSYVGNGNNSPDGTFVYTGFRPAWVMVKDVTDTSAWVIIDNKRAEPYNIDTARIYADDNLAETALNTNRYMELFSNGFRVHGNNASSVTNKWNESNDSYVYLAFAEQPFKYANAR